MSHLASWFKMQRIIRKNCTCWDLIDEIEFRKCAVRLIAGEYKE